IPKLRLVPATGCQPAPIPTKTHGAERNAQAQCIEQRFAGFRFPNEDKTILSRGGRSFAIRGERCELYAIGMLLERMARFACVGIEKGRRTGNEFAVTGTDDHVRRVWSKRER